MPRRHRREVELNLIEAVGEASGLECCEERLVVVARRQIGDVGLRRHPLQPGLALELGEGEVEGVKLGENSGALI